MILKASKTRSLSHLQKIQSYVYIHLAENGGGEEPLDYMQRSNVTAQIDKSVIHTREAFGNVYLKAGMFC